MASEVSASALLRGGQRVLISWTGPERRFWSLVVVTGVVAGGSAALLLNVLRFAQHLAWGAGEGPFLQVVEGTPNLRRLLVPLIGGVLVSGVSLVVGRSLRGHGTAGIIEALWIGSDRLPFWKTVMRGLLSIVAVALGAPLGREGALLQTGAATSSALSRLLRLREEQTRLLIACGASAGLAAAYNVPIGAALFGLEVLLGSFALELFGPIVLASVVSTLVSRILIADHPSYIIPQYGMTTPREVVLAIVLGLILGGASAFYVRTVEGAGELLQLVPQRVRPFLPILTMAAVGGAAIFVPQILGNGYDSVNAALQAQLPLLLLLLLPFAKLLATALVAGAGVPGGLFTPSLFYGALLGGAVGHAFQMIPGATLPPGTYALLGMGAVLAGTTHASVSAVLIIFEMTGSYDVILPLMAATVVSATVSRYLCEDSLYSAVLRRRNVMLPGTTRPNWLTPRGIGELLEPALVCVLPNANFEEITVALLEAPVGHDLYVTSSEGRYIGSILLHELKAHLGDRALLRMLIARDVISPGVHPLTHSTSLTQAAEQFSHTELERLPVIDAQGLLLGTVSKGDMLKYGTF